MVLEEEGDGEPMATVGAKGVEEGEGEAITTVGSPGDEGGSPWEGVLETRVDQS